MIYPQEKNLTGDVMSPVFAYKYYVVRVPDDLNLVMALNGALVGLGKSANWKQVLGDETPEDAALLMRDVFDSREVGTMPLGSMAYQEDSAVDVNGGSLDNTVIGAVTPAAIFGTLIEASTGFRANAPPGVALAYSWRRNGILRFLLNMTATAEPGGNVGSDFAFSAFSDTGVLLRTFMSFGRSTLKLTLNGPIDISGDLSHVGSLFGMRGAGATVAPTVTGSRGGNVALANLLTALHNQRIIVDNTTI